MKQIISKIGKSVIPSNNIKKVKKQIADEAFALVENQIRNYPEIVGLEFGGSYAKDTWLSKEADVDIFIKFKKSIPDEKFTEISILAIICFIIQPLSPLNQNIQILLN